MTNKRQPSQPLRQRDEIETDQPDPTLSWSDVESIDDMYKRIDAKYPTLPPLSKEPKEKATSPSIPAIAAPRRKLDDDTEVKPATILEFYIHRLGQRNFIVKQSDFPDVPGYLVAFRKLVNDGYLVKNDRNRYFYQPQRLDVGASSNPWPRRAVFCLETAVWLHNNSDIVPSLVFVAIDYQSPLQLPYPKFRVKTIPEKKDFIFGLTSVNIGSLSYRVYSRERTIADLIYYQSKRTGRLETAERALVSWWKKDLISLSELVDAAKARAVEQEIKPYLAMLPHIPKGRRSQRR